jgi:hypothetical protein
MKLRTMAIIGALGVAAIALIGAGAAAQFQTSTTSSQTITAGTMNVVLTSDCAQSGNGTANLTLANEAPVASSFETSPCVITVNNNGNVPVTYTSIALTAAYDGTTAGAALQNETYACFYGPEVDSSPDTSIIGFNESVDAAIAQGAVGVGGTIAAGDTDTYIMVFYAGPTTDTGCGSDIPSYTPTDYPQVPGTNSAAASLNSDSEGGSFTPSLTLTYSG